MMDPKVHPAFDGHEEVAQSSPERARALLARLRKRTDILKTLPRAGRPRPELGDSLRSLVDRPYVVIYRLIGGDAEIVAILHGARDLPAAFASRLDRDE